MTKQQATGSVNVPVRTIPRQMECTLLLGCHIPYCEVTFCCKKAKTTLLPLLVLACEKLSLTVEQKSQSQHPENRHANLLREQGPTRATNESDEPMEV